MKTKLLFLILLSAFLSNAQSPWRAKLFVHFLDSNNQILTDTVWFGCDSLGNIGYQEGLDIFDTVVAPNRILGFDSLVQIQRQTDCVNLKQNIRAFKIAIAEFDFYAIGNVVAISWDTTDFKYDDSTYKLRSAWLTSKNAYLDLIDANKFIIYNNSRPENKFGSDSISVIQGSTINDCFFLDEVIHFKLSVAMGYGISGLKDVLNEEIGFNAFPIPSNDVININFTSISNHKLEIKNQLGLIVLRITLKDLENTVNTEFLSGGIYYMTLTDAAHQAKQTKKIIIKH